jgi:hypothetical protein
VGQCRTVQKPGQRPAPLRFSRDVRAQQSIEFGASWPAKRIPSVSFFRRTRQIVFGPAAASGRTRRIENAIVMQLHWGALSGDSMSLRQFSRRHLISLLATSTAATFALWRLRADAQQSPLPVIGSLNGTSLRTWQAYLAAYRRGWRKPDLSKAATSPSSFVSRMATTTACRKWPQSSCIARSPSCW